MKTEPRAASTHRLSICDTSSYPAPQAFAAFREAVAGAFMPWSLDQDELKQAFSARIANFSTDAISFGRSRMAPVTGVRDKLEISKSPDLCLYANYVISGELIVEQGGRVTKANPGDLVLYDSTLPVNHVKVGDAPFEDLSFSISKTRIASEGRIFENLAIPGPKIIAPLAASLKFLSDNISCSLPDELDALGHVCATLLSIVPDQPLNHSGLFDLLSNQHVREMIRYIDANLDRSELTPAEVAEHLGISVRYVHKQFASLGTTFGAYLRSRRLEHVRADLISEAARHQPISNLVYRWGFNDLSTFNRAFKRAYGCLPSSYRARQ